MCVYCHAIECRTQCIMGTSFSSVCCFAVFLLQHYLWLFWCTRWFCFCQSQSLSLPLTPGRRESRRRAGLHLGLSARPLMHWKRQGCIMCPCDITPLSIPTADDCINQAAWIMLNKRENFLFLCVEKRKRNSCWFVVVNLNTCCLDSQRRFFIRSIFCIYLIKGISLCHMMHHKGNNLRNHLHIHGITIMMQIKSGRTLRPFIWTIFTQILIFLN